MKKLAHALTKVSSTLIVGVLVALLIQTAWAVTGPDCEPSDPSSGCTVIPQFTALLIGSGTLPSADDLKVDGNSTTVGTVFTDSLESYSGGPIVTTSDIEMEDDGTITVDHLQSYVDGLIDVNASLKIAGGAYLDTRDIQSTSSTYIDSANVMRAPGFGFYYYIKEKCGSGYSACNYTGGAGEVGATYYLRSSCNAGDILISCSGWNRLPTTTNSKYIGSRIVKVGGNFECEGRAKVSNVTTNIVCLSPDADASDVGF